MEQYDVLVVGGGAAGFFAAINTAERNPALSVAILERGTSVLNKVKVSGGGRCNVTHAEFIPNELASYYPRGQKELKGPFHSFMTGDTMAWFESRGVPLKIEDDGRVFPESNSSQSIIDCFLKQSQKYDIKLKKNHAVRSIGQTGDSWAVETTKEVFYCKKLMIATGSNPKIWQMLQSLGHNISPAVPSLFTFDIDDPRLKDIPGVVAKDVAVEVMGTSLHSEGPLLITHSGLSAPSILKLSAFGAIELAQLNYKFEIKINFIQQDAASCLEVLMKNKLELSKKLVRNTPLFELPKRLWVKLVQAAAIADELRWADLNKLQLQSLSKQLTKAVFQVHGKSTFKEEFVTAGGIDLKEINFKTYESKLFKNLFFAGEIINIDGVTGGFNFQNAWTGAYLAAQELSK
ncbi:flavoprotein [Formosa sp. Hel3_A1_48]|jgi:predicted Rossmann fold flavoprotein|uniref:NAD(P)/FAD-dependent oxidoreductase n=1 Tax=Formosa sp. Hel3_A1_48 TaxID=1336795 RepID=UPI00084E1D11|nr:NAD(P)/FAD-dependent oxidoreductase [Formosa sp. Hel3_A1_48]AOR26047.1 flavoprotein [Formosa sp. Hel3_A1_48]